MEVWHYRMLLGSQSCNLAALLSITILPRLTLITTQLSCDRQRVDHVKFLKSAIWLVITRFWICNVIDPRNCLVATRPSLVACEEVWYIWGWDYNWKYISIAEDQWVIYTTDLHNCRRNEPFHYTVLSTKMCNSLPMRSSLISDIDQYIPPLVHYT